MSPLESTPPNFRSPEEFADVRTVVTPTDTITIGTCFCSFTDTNAAEMQANAALISAAPELYYALERRVNLCDCSDCDCSGCREDFALLAKARGDA